MERSLPSQQTATESLDKVERIVFCLELPTASAAVFVLPLLPSPNPSTTSCNELMREILEVYKMLLFVLEQDAFNT